MVAWTELTPGQKRDQVRLHVEQNGLTYSQAAKILGTTRVAIAGVVERAKGAGQPIVSPNLEGRPHANGQPRRPTDRKRQPDDDRPIYSYAWDALPGSSPVRLEDHTTGCRWAIAWPGERVARYCNNATDGTSMYCSGHHQLGVRA